MPPLYSVFFRSLTVRNHIVKHVTVDKGLVNRERQEVEHYYRKEKGQGTGWDSHGKEKDRVGTTE